jgi:hypothetical protein
LGAATPVPLAGFITPDPGRFDLKSEKILADDEVLSLIVMVAHRNVA